MVEKADWDGSSLESLIGKTFIGKDKKVLAYNRKTDELEETKLSFYNALKLRVNGFVKVDDRQYENWSGKLPFYIYTCKVKGEKVFLLDYPHGFSSRLVCRL